MFPRRQLIVGGAIVVSIGVLVVASGLWWLDDDAKLTRGFSSSTSTGMPKLAEQPTPFRVAKRVDFQQLDDAERDGWTSEVVSAAALRQLNLLGDLLANNDFQTDQVERLVRKDVRSESLLPTKLAIEYRDAELKVERLDRKNNPSAFRSGIGNFIEELQAVRSQFGDRCELRSKFKIVGIEDGSSIRTRQHGTIVGKIREKGMCEQHFTWSINWATDGSALKIASLDVEAFEQVTRRTATTLLADFTESVIGKNESYRRQFLKGYGHWLERLQDHNSYAILGTPGIAIGDVNADGLDDLYVCQEEGLPNRLFLHQSDGTARDVSREAKVDWLERTRSALLIDIDNDGDQDLVAALMGNIVAAANDGAGHFEIMTVIPCGFDTMSISAADYDLDGDLDLYVCIHAPSDRSLDNDGESIVALSRRVVYHDSNNAGANHLFRNESANGSWKFVDVTKQVGLDQNNRRFSFSAAWEDYDNDGDQDLYVANDFGRNNLFRNERDGRGFVRFVDVASETESEDSASGMSVTWGDYDRDGRADLYVSNMFSAAGQRITKHDRFQEDSSSAIKQRLKRFARGNTLMRNRPSGVFQDVSEEAGVTMGRWAWSSNFVDLNNDGWEDLVVANGFITGQDTGDL